MTTFIINRRRPRVLLPAINIRPLFYLLMAMLIVYHTFPFWVYQLDPTAALPDAGIWVLIFMALLVFILLLLLSWYLFNKIWNNLGLPPVDELVLQFTALTVWQQIMVYWASFAMMLLTAVGCLVAIF